jgi:hypothetical protein
MACARGSGVRGRRLWRGERARHGSHHQTECPAGRHEHLETGRRLNLELSGCVGEHVAADIRCYPDDRSQFIHAQDNNPGNECHDDADDRAGGSRSNDHRSASTPDAQVVRFGRL